MHEMRTIAIDDPVAWAPVSQPVSLFAMRVIFGVFAQSPDDATLMRSLLHYCSHLYVAVNCTLLKRHKLKSPSAVCKIT